MAKGRTAKGEKGKPQLRIAKDLYDWLGEHAAANRDGFTSRALVAEEAIRRYRDHVRAQALVPTPPRTR